MRAAASSRSTEVGFLCLIARPRPDWSAAVSLLRAGLDLDAAMHLAEQHSVRPQLLEAFGHLGWEGVPDAVRAECEGFQRLHLARMLFLTDMLRRVDTLFAAHGIPLVTFKGAALAATLYGDLSKREYGDLDILVRPEHVAEGERLLNALGFGGPLRDAQLRHTFLAYQRQYAFVHDAMRVSVDLHWHFNGVHSPFPLRPEDVWNDPAHVQMGDRSIATLGGANLALLLAGHGTKERWKKLGWVRDFAVLAERHPDLDWHSVFVRARAAGCGNAVLLGCAVAHELLDMPIASALAPEIARNARVRDLAGAIVGTTRSGRPFAPVRPYLEDLDLCDRRWDKIASVVRQGMTRTVGDYESWPLPPPLWGVYRLTRPFRLLAKQARKASMDATGC